MKRQSSATERRFEKARAYHRRWCWREVRLEEGIQVWRLALAPKFELYTQMVEKVDAK